MKKRKPNYVNGIHDSYWSCHFFLMGQQLCSLHFQWSLIQSKNTSFDCSCHHVHNILLHFSSSYISSCTYCTRMHFSPRVISDDQKCISTAFCWPWLTYAWRLDTSRENLFWESCWWATPHPLQRSCKTKGCKGSTKQQQSECELTTLNI